MLFVSVLNAQNTQVSGTITEKKTGNPIPYANIIYSGTFIGTTSDINGKFNFVTAKPSKTIEISAIGYQKQVIPVQFNQINQIDIALEEEIFTLDEIKILPGENPANILMRKVFENKDQNNPNSLPSWKSHIYAKTEIDLKNVNRELGNKKALKQFEFIFNYLDSMGAEGKTFLPVFFTETVSTFYHDAESGKNRELIIANKTSGIKTDYFSQLTGKYYENTNLYDNYITLSDVALISPVNNLGLQFYKYYLVDSVVSEANTIYELSFRPKLPQEPVFTGKLWVEDKSFAVTKAELQLAEKANVNFINNLQYKVEFQKTGQKWVPRNELLVADIDIQKNKDSEMLGVIARKSNIYIDFTFQPVTQEMQKLKEQITVLPDAVDKTDDYWLQTRPVELQKREADIYAMVDSIKDVKLFRTVAEYVYMFYYGYRDLGKVELGPYYYLYSANKVEGSRFRLGARTTYKFDKNLRINGFAAYGTLDREFKYGGGFEYFFSIKPLSVIQFQAQRDMEMLGKSDNAFMEQNIVTTILSKGLNSKLNMVDRFTLTAKKEWRPGLLNEFSIATFKIHTAPYVPLITAEGNEIPYVQGNELGFKFRFAPNEEILRDDFDRTALTGYDPVFTFNATKGFEGFLGGGYDYLKIHAGISDRIKINPLGYTYYYLQAGKIWGDVPFPFLKIHEGNETYAFDAHAFNLMQYQEFISDTYVSLFWEHHFTGFFLNKMPLFRKLKWREVIGTRVLWGNYDETNHNSLVLPGNMKGLGDQPYTEFSVGLENIFKFFRVDGTWRFNYNEPGIPQFGLLFTLQLTL